MSPLTTYILLIFLGLFALITLTDLIRNRSLRRLSGHLALLIGVTLVFYVTTGFPISQSRQAFGSAFSPEIAIFIMFICVLLGIAARYIFYLQGHFIWLDFMRPLVVSPLILLPLLGSLQGIALGSLQMICFAILAFQNGLFWQQVLQEAKPSTQVIQNATRTA
jgi:hypothetical protein